jgi:hypothetical protein
VRSGDDHGAGPDRRPAVTLSSIRPFPSEIDANGFERAHSTIS